MHHHFIDMHRAESNNPHAHRELMLHIWHPTDNPTKITQTLYDQDALENTREFIHQQSGVPLWLLSGLNNTKTYAKPHEPISLHNAQYPVIIISHGAGPMIEHYTALCEELASNGYIVVGVNRPYMAPITRFPDGRIIKGLLNSKKKEGKEVAKIWKKEQAEVAVHDMEFVLNSLEQLNAQPSFPLYKKLDLDHIGICGHSAGGALAMRMCMEDARLKAGVALDSEIRDDKTMPFSTPFLAMIGEKSHVWAGQEGKEAQEKLTQFSLEPNVRMSIIRFKNAGHGVFYDLPLLLHTTLATQIASHFIPVDVDTSSSQARDISKKVNEHIVNFFDTYLK
jgi:dienelactone hydrolase